MKTEQDEKVVTIKVNLKATLRDAITGEIKEVQEVHNIVPTVARAAIANYLTHASPTPSTLYVNKGAVGTGTNAPANGDTTLQTETYRNNIASSVSSSNVAYLSMFLNASEAASSTLREAGLFIGGSGTVDTGTLLSRVAINIVKGVADTLTLDWTITVS